MNENEPTYFDLDTVALLRETLDYEWASLSPIQRIATTRSLLAARILKVAARGERDREKLLDAALLDLVVAEAEV